MNFTKGKHAFFVATHIDKKHIHNHIIYNSTKLDCSGKFRDFLRSGRAVRLVSDTICLSHGLSVIEARPYDARSKKNVYPEKESFRNVIRGDIDRIIEKKPTDYALFLQYLADAGYTIKKGKYLAVKRKEQSRFIRFRSLGELYSENNIKNRIAGKDIVVREQKMDSSQNKLDLLVDIERKLREGKGIGYERWAKVFNVKQMSKVLLFLQEHEIRDYDELIKKTDLFTEQFNQLTVAIKMKEQRLTTIRRLQKAIVNYSKTREVYIEYRKAGYSRKYFEVHKQEIQIHQAAKEAFSSCEKSKIPKMKELGEEYQKLLVEKRLNYQDYQKVRKEMQDFLIARKNMELMLGTVDETKAIRYPLQPLPYYGNV